MPAAAVDRGQVQVYIYMLLLSRRSTSMSHLAEGCAGGVTSPSCAHGPKHYLSRLGCRSAPQNVSQAGPMRRSRRAPSPGIHTFAHLLCPPPVSTRCAAWLPPGLLTAECYRPHPVSAASHSVCVASTATIRLYETAQDRIFTPRAVADPQPPHLAVMARPLAGPQQ